MQRYERPMPTLDDSLQALADDIFHLHVLPATKRIYGVPSAEERVEVRYDLESAEYMVRYGGHEVRISLSKDPLRRWEDAEDRLFDAIWNLVTDPFERTWDEVEAVEAEMYPLL